MSDRASDTGTGSFRTLVGMLSGTASAFRWSTTPASLSAILLLLTLVVLWTADGLVGIGVWILLAVSWVAFPPIITVGIGQFAVLGVFQTGDISVILLTEGLLLALITIEESWSLVGRLVFLGVTALILVLTVVLVRTSGILTAVLGVAVIFGSCSYFFHRYLLIRLGLVIDKSDPPPDD